MYHLTTAGTSKTIKCRFIKGIHISPVHDLKHRMKSIKGS